MIETVRPWLGVVAGLVLIWNGMRMIARPEPYIETGFVPASDPRTVKMFGTASVLFGLVIALLNLSHFASE